MANLHIPVTGMCPGTWGMNEKINEWSLRICLAETPDKDLEVKKTFPFLIKFQSLGQTQGVRREPYKLIELPTIV